MVRRDDKMMRERGEASTCQGESLLFPFLLACFLYIHIRLITVHHCTSCHYYTGVVVGLEYGVSNRILAGQGVCTWTLSLCPDSTVRARIFIRNSQGCPVWTVHCLESPASPRKVRAERTDLRLGQIPDGRCVTRQDIGARVSFFVPFILS